MDARPGLTDVRQDQAFFGREEELRRVLNNLREGRHTLITGRFGIGKSTLMNEARLLLTGEKHRVDFHSRAPALGRDSVLTVTSPAPLGECLRELAGGLYRNGDLHLEAGGERADWGAVKKEFTRLGVRTMESEVLKGLAGGGKKYVLFIANLDRISLSSMRFFQSLVRITIVCGSAIETKDLEPFKGFWASFDRVQLERLPDGVARQLVSHLMSLSSLHAEDTAMCRNEILNSADGNPFHIKNLVYRAATQKSLGKQEIRAFREVEEGPYFNMGPLYMIGAGVLTAVKFFSAGTEKREHYIYYSAIGFILYLTFRVFRSFFVFRPQRRK
jgi:hypothetical protein